MKQRLLKHPGDTDARFALARALAHQQKFKAATAEYARLLKKYPANPDYLLGLAQVKLWSGQPREALPYLAQARHFAPHYADVWRAEIQALSALGDEVGARTLRNEARQTFPTENWTFAHVDEPAVHPLQGSSGSAEPNPPATALAQESAPETIAPAGIAGAAIPPLATHTAKPRTAIEVGVSRERLTRGLSAWHSRYLRGEHRTADDTMFYGGLRETERYARVDHEAHFGIGAPVTSSLRFQAEAGTSNTHRVLPARYGAVALQYAPAAGWTLSGGWRRSAYNSGMTGIIHLGVDRYVGAERFSYTLYSGGPDGSGSAPSHRLQWAHYYGERDWVGIALSTGRETENQGTAGFLTSQVSGLNVSGRHSLDSVWSLVWEVSRVRQGESYTRNGASLGLRYSF